MPIRLVAIDIDGTLLDRSKRITPRTADAIAGCRRRGVRVVLASARPPRSVVDIYRRLDLETCTINYNGALVFDPHTREVLEHRPIDRDLADELIRFGRAFDREVLVSVERLDRWFTDRVDDRYQTETARHFHPDRLGPIDEWLTEPITKLMFLGEPAMVTALSGRLGAVFARRIAMVQTDTFMVQLMHPRASKAVSLRRVCTRYGIDPSEVMAIGDAANDVGMIQWARVGVAMGHAPDLVIRAADYVAAGNDHDGAAEAIERYVL